MIRTLLAAGTALSLTMTCSIAHAQDGDNAPAVEDIVVIAQKRSERLQDVPMAISALSSDALEGANVNGGLDFGKVVPSLSITQGNGTLIPFLRGIGNPSNGQAIEASSSMYIDGIYYQRLSPLYFSMNNIERIEVLKGPQGTLFGRNAVGGVIHIITRDPDDTPKFHMQGGYGNYDTFSGNLYASVPVADGVAFDIAAAGNYQRDGWGTNVTTGNPFGYDRSFSARSKLVIKPGDRTTIKFSVDYNRLRSTISVPGRGYRGTTQGNALPPFQLYLPEDIGFYDNRGNIDSKVGGQGWGASANISHDLDFATLVSITGYSKAKDLFYFDGDFTPRNEQILNLPTHRRQFSQELQLVSGPDSPFDWLFGLYHLELKSAHEQASFTGQLFGGGRFFDGALKTKSNAIFGQATFKLLPRTSATIGLRYTKDKLRNYGQVTTFSLAGVPTAGPYIDQGDSFSKVTYKFVLDHHFNDDILGYASYSRGFKSGAFRITPVQALPAARPEILDAYEVGLKSSLFDRRLTINMAAFYYDLKDPQVSRYLGGGGTVIYINADSAEVKGFEIEGNAALTKQLSARFGATWLRSKYTSFTGAPFANINPNPPFGNTPTFPGDASGNYTTRAPKLTATLGLDYRIPVGDGEVKLSGSYYYNDGFYWDPDNRLRQRAYSLFDANIGYRPKLDGGWNFSIWGKNLSGVKYYLQENESGGAGGSSSAAAAPRTYGFTIGVDI